MVGCLSSGGDNEMKIRTKLSLNAVVSICLAILVGITLFITFFYVQRAVTESILADQIVARLNGLTRATYEYSLHSDEGRDAQWRQRYDCVQELLQKTRFDEKEDTLVLNKISEDIKGIKILLDQVRAEKEGLKISSGTEGSHFDQLNRIFVSQITETTEIMVNDATQLTRSNNREIVSAVRNSFLFLIIPVLLMLVFIFTTSLQMKRGLIRSLRELERGAEMIADGKWDHKVHLEGGDEAAKLARAFNEMTDRLRVSYSALENEIAERKQTEGNLRERTHELNERIKEVRCLFAICEFVEKQETEEEIFRRIVEIMPSGWQYPEIACARITLHGKEFKTDKFKETSWKQAADIIYHGQKTGSVEILYLEDRPVRDEGPFLKQERELLIAIAKEIGEVSKRKEAEQKAEAEYSFRRAIENSILSGISAVDREGRQIYVSPAFCKMVGWSEEDLLGTRPPFIYWPPEEIENLRPNFEEIYTGNQPPGSIEARFRKRSGERFDALLFHSPLRDSRDKLIGWVGSIADITERKRMEGALKDSERQLKLLASQLLSTQEEERKRVAGDLHDSIAASLTGIKFSIETILTGTEAGTAAYESLNALVVKIQQIIEEIRRIIANLRPSVLDHLGIKAVIGWLCRGFEETYSKIVVQKKVEINEQEVPDSLKIVIFRILQEALNNVAKHSRGNLAHVRLGKSDSKIELSVKDNGSGFSLDEIIGAGRDASGLGVLSMKERAKLSGGTFDIKSVKGAGTTIRVTWPL